MSTIKVQNIYETTNFFTDYFLLLLSAKTQRLINHLSAMPTNMYCGFFF